MWRHSAVLAWSAPVLVLACALGSLAFVARFRPASIVAAVDSSELPADGTSTALITIRNSTGGTLKALSARITDGTRRATIENIRSLDDRTEVTVRAGVVAGPVTIEVDAEGVQPVRVSLTTSLDTSDSAHDGTPDSLRLDDPSDRRSFREWFTFLAEHEAFRANQELSPEINDCAALVRYAYRESLREHNGEWATELRLTDVTSPTSVQKFNYPFTPLGAALFRVKPGSFKSDDLGDGTFAQFADARVIQNLNTHFVSRDLRRARPGDLLFFEQEEQRMSHHVMLFIGRSHLEDRGRYRQLTLAPELADNWLVYHTGPVGDSKGEIRRVRISDLMRHPDPRWRPWPNNRNFLGVYRWNILREAND